MVPLGSVAWLAESSLCCPTHTHFQSVPHFPAAPPECPVHPSEDGECPNRERNNPPLPRRLVSIRCSVVTATRKAAAHASKNFEQKKHIYTHMSTVTPLKTAGDSTAGCPAGRGVGDSGHSGRRLAGGRHDVYCSSVSDRQEHMPSQRGQTRKVAQDLHKTPTITLKGVQLLVGWPALELDWMS